MWDDGESCPRDSEKVCLTWEQERGAGKRFFFEEPGVLVGT